MLDLLRRSNFHIRDVESDFGKSETILLHFRKESIDEIADRLAVIAHGIGANISNDKYTVFIELDLILCYIDKDIDRLCYEQCGCICTTKGGKSWIAVHFRKFTPRVVPRIKIAVGNDISARIDERTPIVFIARAVGKRKADGKSRFRGDCRVCRIIHRPRDLFHFGRRTDLTCDVIRKEAIPAEADSQSILCKPFRCTGDHEDIAIHTLQNDLQNKDRADPITERAIMTCISIRRSACRKRCQCFSVQCGNGHRLSGARSIKIPPPVDKHCSTRLHDRCRVPTVLSISKFDPYIPIIRISGVIPLITECKIAADGHFTAGNIVLPFRTGIEIHNIRFRVQHHLVVRA